MCALQILVKPITFRNKLLLPLTEPILFFLDLLREPLPQRLLFFLELGVVQLAWPCFAELACLHLLRAVRLVVHLFRRMDKIEHVRANENATELLEVAMVVVLNFSYTPVVLTALDNATVASLDVFLGTDDREGHGSDEITRVLGGGFVVFFNWRLVDLDSLGVDDGAYL